MEISRVVIPAAGLGSRFLPYTKTIPKEMLPLGNKPAIQVIIEEAYAAQMHQFFVIINNEKQAIFDHFSPKPSLDHWLQKKNKLDLLADIKKLEQAITLTPLQQAEPLGLGHAILMAQEAVGNNFFSIMLPDDIIVGVEPEIARLASVARTYQSTVIAVQEMPREAVSAYGVIKIKNQLSDDLFEVADYVEKPAPDEAPSTLCSIGRFVASPLLFSSLEKTQPGAGNEIQLTDGITHMMRHQHEKVYALKVAGKRFDIGTPHGWTDAIKSGNFCV